MGLDRLPEIIKEVIKEEDSFTIISHTMPDGDSIGSTIALSRALKLAGKEVVACSVDEVPRKYRFLDREGIVVNDVSDCGSGSLFVLDCSDVFRIGTEPDFIKGFHRVINIDHHITNNYFGDINIVDPEASATGEILYRMIKELALPVNLEIAEALYTAIITDTGLFKYENTSPETYQVASELLKNGVNPGIAQRIFDEYPLDYLLLLKQAISTLEMWDQPKMACLTVSEEMRLQCGASMESLEGLVNYAKNIEGVEIGVLIYLNSSGEVKVGLRSKNVDVSKIAERFNGGGHKKAAGFKIKTDYQSIKEDIVKISRQLT